MNVQHQLDDQWKELNKRERLVLYSFLGFVPLAGGLGYIASKITDIEWLILFGPVGCMLFIVVSWLRFLLFPCPKCGKAFHTKPLGSFTTGRQCAHCGLPRNAQL